MPAQGGQVVGIGTPTLPDPVPVPVTTTNPLAGRRLYADGRDWTQQQALGSLTGAAADTVRALATVPQATWVGPGDRVEWIADYVDRATAAGALPSLVLYAIPGRDCGSYSAGGSTSAASYLAWVAGVRTAIAGRPVLVVVEPDALAQGSCSGTATDTAARLATLASAVDLLTADPGTAVYLDAGHEWWLTPQEAATRLVAAHVGRARGFSLDVSNFYATDGEVAYGRQVAELVRTLDPTADPHLVVDTSRNGAGPAPAGPGDWCNPAGRLLGHAPGAVPGGGVLDGYLWVKHPGESDGSCHPGDPASGVWFPGWADDLVARSVAAGLLAVR
ncbi:glycoside hydrolase family 6 protein [Lapillicoccus jejuensis]